MTVLDVTNWLVLAYLVSGIVAAAVFVICKVFSRTYKLLEEYQRKCHYQRKLQKDQKCKTLDRVRNQPDWVDVEIRDGRIIEIPRVPSSIRPECRGIGNNSRGCA
jgi:hypothetical protein